jgi:hypothetical protein
MNLARFDHNSNQIQSEVTPDNFAQFTGYLKSKQLPDIAAANASSDVHYVKNLARVTSRRMAAIGS